MRVDGQNWKALRPEDPLIKELRLLCRDEVSLIEQRTAFIDQLRQALGEYYPTALEAFEDWTSVSAWLFLQRFPTPELLAQAGKRQWEKFLHARRLWGSDQGPRRMELFAHATEFAGTPPTTITNVGPATNISVMPSIFSLITACRVAPGPTFTINITAKRTRATPMLCADSATAGSKSFTKCGSIEPLTIPSFIIAINSVKLGSWIFQLQES